MIAVTFALPAESADFIALLQDRETGQGAKGDATGTLHRHNIAVAHTGVGKLSARERVDALLSGASPQLLISSGFAGATNNELKPGDMLLAENFCTPEMLVIARSALLRTNIHSGTLATAPSVIDSAADRERFARDAGAIAIDMETQFIADSCAERGIPILALRAITDTPAFPFPAPPDVLFDVEKQRTVAPRLAFYLATHPLAIVRLVSFARRVSAARAALAATLDLLLRSESLAARRTR